MTGLLVAGALRAEALVIQYQAIDLADVEAGKDLWRYTYQISDYTFQADEGFDIFFNQALYRNLSNPQPDSGPQWFAAASINGVPGDPAIFDAITVVGSPSLATIFSVDFEWLGGGTPGAQPFDVFRTADGNLEVFFRGATNVPDGGSTLMLSGLGLGALLTPRWLRRRRAANGEA